MAMELLCGGRRPPKTPCLLWLAMLLVSALGAEICEEAEGRRTEVRKGGSPSNASRVVLSHESTTKILPCELFFGLFESFCTLKISGNEKDLFKELSVKS